VAVAHTRLVIVYHLLKAGTTYRELGANYFDQLDAERTTRKLVRRLKQLGHTLSLTATIP
jgi:transposase